MDANTFLQTARGKTAADAFANAVKEAQYAHGHRGYTGSLAEKDSFVEIPLPQDKTPSQYARELIDANDERIDDKWGPAGCIRCGPDLFLFFGWASS